jgi:hypothetical protein
MGKAANLGARAREAREEPLLCFVSYGGQKGVLRLDRWVNGKTHILTILFIDPFRSSGRKSVVTILTD